MATLDDLERLGPKRADHPTVGWNCPICNQPFKEGDYTALIAKGPASEEDAIKAAKGRPYTAEAAEVHWECVALAMSEEDA